MNGYQDLPLLAAHNVRAFIGGCYKRGASIPLEAARTLWDKLTTKKPIHGLPLGNYTVTSFDGSELIVGCHNIPMKEVFRMARALKWAANDGASLEAVI